VTSVSITGATGYLGRALSAALLERGYSVCALIRPGTADRVARGAQVTELNVFSADELFNALRADCTLVHLIGTAHPNPRKAAEFVRVDLASVRASAAAAARARSRISYM
jgi:nucleoside-diphosphate-sugar epimerase